MADQTQDGSINTNFAHAEPESNVGPAGAPQTSHGNAGLPIGGGTVVQGDPQPAGGDTVAGQTVQTGEDGGTDNSGIIDRVADRANPIGPADGRDI
jgi:hypothetical protein